MVEPPLRKKYESQWEGFCHKSWKNKTYLKVGLMTFPILCKIIIHSMEFHGIPVTTNQLFINQLIYQPVIHRWFRPKFPRPGLLLLLLHGGHKPGPVTVTGTWGTWGTRNPERFKGVPKPSLQGGGFTCNFPMTQYVYIWVNYNISPTWIKAILGWFPLLTIIPSEVAVRSL